MALKGTLKDFALPDIFQLIGMQRKTGLLTLESERETVTVVFENGMVVHADSSVRRLDDLLGSVLVRQGRLKKDDLEEALSRQRVSMQRLGYILTTQGYIEANDLKEALAAQMQQIVFRVFRWKQGQYHFDPSPSVDYDRANVTPMSADHILMEGIRRVDEWPIIEKRIPSLEMIYRPLMPRSQLRVGGGRDASDVNLDRVLGEASGSPSPGAESATLSQEEARIFELVDGKNSVAAIVEMTGLSDFDVCRTMFDFLDRNLIAPTQEPAPRGRASRVEGVVHAPPSSPLGWLVLTVTVLSALLGLYLSVGDRAPFRLPGLQNPLPGEIHVIRASISVARLQRVDAALRIYFLTRGQYPEQMQRVLELNPGLLTASDLEDGWGRPFEYWNDGAFVQLRGVDASGQPYLTFVHQVGF